MTKLIDLDNFDPRSIEKGKKQQYFTVNDEEKKGIFGEYKVEPDKKSKDKSECKEFSYTSNCNCDCNCSDCW